MLDQEGKVIPGDFDTAQSGFFNHLGLELVEWGEDNAVLELEIAPHHLNRAGVLHGGVITALIDTVCGFSGCFCAEAGRLRKAVTLSLTTSFTGQVRMGRIQAVGKKRVNGRKIFFATAEVFGPAGEIIAIGEGAYRYRAGSEPSGGGTA